MNLPPNHATPPLPYGERVGVRGLAPVLLAGGLLVAGCAASRAVGRAAPDRHGGNRQGARIVANNFTFEPGTIQIKAGTPLVLEVYNAASGTHNLTLYAPDEKVVVARDLPGGTTTVVELPALAKGRYPVRCEKFMHGAMGMKATLVAE